MQEEDLPQPSYVEVAYDKTAAVVSTVKDLFVNGLSKLKSFIVTARERSRTSRSHRRGRGGQSEEDDDDESLRRYKTPVGGRSKSRGFSKVVPMNEVERDDSRKRHVNFKINRVIGDSQESDDESMDL